MNKNINIIISGGGTGGHIYPAVAIASAIKELNPLTQILFIGAKGKMEMEKVPAAGYSIKGIDILGLQRKITFKNLMLPFYVLKSVLQVKSAFKEFKPDVVVGTGGYVSFPVLITAQMLNIPTYIQEQNAYAGLANKLLSKRAKKIFVAFDNLEKFFPKNKLLITGNPVRNHLVDVHLIKQQALNYFSLQNNRPVVLVLGGSLGAKTINQTIEKNIHYFTANKIQLIWQMGKNYYEQLNKEFKDALNAHHIYFKDFIHDMNMAYAAADIIISRAGASTIAELAMVQKPSILIPSPNVTDDHQTKNAMALHQKNAAILIKDIDAEKKLITTLNDLIAHPDKQHQLSQNIQSFAKPDAAKIIAQTILQDISLK